VASRGRPRKVFIGDIESQVANNAAGSTASLDIIAPSTEFRDELPLLGETTSSSVEAEVYTTVTLRIPQSLYDEYANTASLQLMDVEEVMQHRLAKCKTHNTLRGLWFSDSERSQLEKLLKKAPIETAAVALTSLSQAGGVDMDGFKVSLTIPQRKILGIRVRNGTTPERIFESMIRREFQV